MPALHARSRRRPPAARRGRRPLPRLVLFSGVAACTVACTGGEPSSVDRGELASLRDQRSQLIRQFGNLQTRIRRTQATALLEPGVREAQEAFYAELRAFAGRGLPGDSALLDRALAVGADLTRLSTPAIRTLDDPGPAPATAAERAAVARELAETERQLRPFVDRAMADPGVRVAFDALRDTLVGTMAAMDPGASRTLERLTDLAARIGALDEEISALQP